MLEKNEMLFVLLYNQANILKQIWKVFGSVFPLLNC